MVGLALQEFAAAGLADEFALTHRHLTTDGHDVGRPSMAMPSNGL